MREYKNRENAQKSAKYTDRFYVPKATSKLDPNDSDFKDTYTKISTKFKLLDAYVELKQLVIYIKPKDNVKVLNFLKEISYDILNELSAIDFIATRGGFEIFYQLLSVTNKNRIRVKTFIKEKETIESVTSIFKIANWQEREMFDMFGVRLINHPKLRRLLMPDDWVGNPLRKAYPLQGDEYSSWYEVDEIYGKENREHIGAEIRDPAWIDRYDSTRFARLGYEPEFGAKVEEGDEKPNPIRYQEDGGVTLIKRLDPAKSKIVKDRNR